MRQAVTAVTVLNGPLLPSFIQLSFLKLSTIWYHEPYALILVVIEDTAVDKGTISHSYSAFYTVFTICISFLKFYNFFWLHLWHVDVPGPETEQPPAAVTTLNP